MATNRLPLPRGVQLVSFTENGIRYLSWRHTASGTHGVPSVQGSDAMKAVTHDAWRTLVRRGVVATTMAPTELAQA